MPSFALKRSAGNRPPLRMQTVRVATLDCQLRTTFKSMPFRCVPPVEAGPSMERLNDKGTSECEEPNALERGRGSTRCK